MNWIFLSLIALVSFSVMVTLITVLARNGYAISFILFALSLVLTIFYFIQTLLTNQFKSIPSIQIFLALLSMGLLASVGNLAQFQAAKDAPNPGLAIAVVGLQGGLIALLAVLFLKDKLTLIQSAGIVLGVVAILLISLGSKPQ